VVSAVRSLFGLDYQGAIEWLIARYCLPKTNNLPSKGLYPKRPIIIMEIFDENRT
jgi:hypothetical protein